MALVTTNSTAEPRSYSLGPIKVQTVNLAAASGDTSGTVTADRLYTISHILVPAGLKLSAAPTYATNVATLAFTVPASTAASKVIQDLTYTAVATDNTGNLITVAYTTGGTAGAEVVTVTGNAISIQIESGVSTATQVRTAFNLVAAATALATCTVSGTGGTAQVSAVAAALTGGITGGAVGTALCFGR